MYYHTCNKYFQEPVEGEDESVAPVVIDRSKLTPTMRHYLSMSKMHSQNAYKAQDAAIQEQNEFTKTFCDQAEYQINKKVHEITVDRNYGKTCKKLLKNENLIKKSKIWLKKSKILSKNRKFG